MRPSQAYMAGLLRMISHGGPLVRPGFIEDDLEKAWARFWADLEALRLIFDDYALIRVSITAPFVTVLGPSERMRRAIQGDEFVAIGTDATEWRVAAVYFEKGEGVRSQLADAIPEAIRSLTSKEGIKPKKGEAICMAITELLAVLTGLYNGTTFIHTRW